MAEGARAQRRTEVGLVSVISPMRNEAGHLDGLLADLAAQTFQGEIELLIADGRSSDGSVAIVEAAASRHGIPLTVLDNPQRSIPHGLNECIRRARGDLLVRLDCHSRYPPDYISRCVAASEETGAEVVGGVVAAAGRTAKEEAVACAMSSPFGGIAWTRDAGRSGRREADTAIFGAFRPAVFERVGLFDETLERNEDEDMTMRIRRAGGQVLLDTSIVVLYTPRGSLRSVLRQYHDYGLWKPVVMARHGRIFSVRSLVPASFVLATTLLALTSLRRPGSRRLLAVDLLAYGASCMAFALEAVRRRGAPLRLVPRTAMVFPAFHLGYGIGTWRGCARILLARLSGTVRPAAGGPAARR